MTRPQLIALILFAGAGAFALISVFVWGSQLNQPSPPPTLPLTNRAVGLTVVALSPITITVTALPAAATLTQTPTFVIGLAASPVPAVTPSITPLPPTPTKPPAATAPPLTPTATPVKYTRGASPIPGPSPTWSVFSFPTRAAAAGPTKLGFHATLNGDVILDYVAKVKPPVIKGVDDIKFLKQVKAVSPNTITIGRYVVPQDKIGEGNPVQRAVEFVAEQLPRYREHSAYVDYWEGLNEVAAVHMAWYTTFEAARACEMQKYGLKAAIGGFSAGTPEPWQFEIFLPAIEAGMRCNAILHLHEYGAPTMYLWWSQGIPASGGRSAVPAYPDRGPLLGRYRYFYRDYLIPRNLVIQLVISETGIDGLVGLGQRPGYSTDEGAGWKGFTAYWAKDLKKDDPTAFYAEQLEWYDSLLRQDEYVIGATIFNVAGGTNAQFTSYEPGKELITKLTEYALGLK